MTTKLFRSATTGERFVGQEMSDGDWLLSGPLSQQEQADCRAAIEADKRLTIDGEIGTLPEGLIVEATT